VSQALVPEAPTPAVMKKFLVSLEGYKFTVFELEGVRTLTRPRSGDATTSLETEWEVDAHDAWHAKTQFQRAMNITKTTADFKVSEVEVKPEPKVDDGPVRRRRR